MFFIRRRAVAKLSPCASHHSFGDIHDLTYSDRNRF
nr:MAG TPA: hypothetical protein [Caudoviricetes sp.]